MNRFGVWLFGFGIFLLLSACAVSAPAPTPPPGLPPASGPSDLQVAVSSDDFVPGAPRVPFVLFSGAQPIADAKAVKVQAYDLNLADSSPPAWSGDAVSYSDYEIPYWVVYPKLPSAGLWGLGLQITQANGQTTFGEFSIEVLPRTASPNIGETPPASRNRTLATEPDIHKLSSGDHPLPALYQMTVADAIKSGKPSVIVFATPGYCASRLCGPVVHSVETVYQEHSADANYIHLEVYKTFGPLVGSDEMDEWRLTSEPWIFLLDRNGKVAARLGGPVSPRELTAALAPLIAP